MKESISWYIPLLVIRILFRYIHKSWQKFILQLAQYKTIHPGFKWQLIIPLTRKISAILGVSENYQGVVQPQIIHHAGFRSTKQWACLLQSLPFSLLFGTTYHINKLCLLFWFLNNWFWICNFQFDSESDYSGVWMLYHSVLRSVYLIRLSLILCSSDGMQWTLYCGISRLQTTLFHSSIILQLFQSVWTHHIILEYQLGSKSNPGTSATWSLNTIWTLITICQLVLYWI